MLYKNIKPAIKELAPIFKEMNWLWWKSDTPPDEEMLEENFKMLIDTLLNGDGYYIASGRCFATRVIDTGEVFIGLTKSSEHEWMDRYE